MDSKRSPLVVCKHLAKAMNNVGMVTSKFDPCIFIEDRVIAVAFVDDIPFWSTEGKFVMALGMKLREQGLLLEEEDGAADCIGVTMERNEDGFIELKQIGLIDRIIEALGLDTKFATKKWVPAEHYTVVKDTGGE
jgi:hypothetical protein